MPSTPLSFRAQQNYAAQKADAAMKNIFATPSEDTPPKEASPFQENLLWGANGPDDLRFQPAPPVIRQNAMATSLQVLMLLSQIRPTEPAFSLNSTRALSTPDHPREIISAPAPVMLENHQPVAEAGAFLLPSAASLPVPAANEGAAWNKQSNSLTLTSEEKKKDFIASLKEYFINSGQLTSNEGEDFELDMRSASAGHPVIIFPLEQPAQNSTDATLTRKKRSLLEPPDSEIAEHIKQHCGIEEEVLDTDGKNRGKMLIFQAQRADKPFRWIYDNNPNGRPTPGERGAADALNITFMVLTAGLLPLIGSMVASAKRHKYYQQQGDEICARRYNHIMLASILTAVDAGSLEYQANAEMRPGTLTSLARAQRPEDRAAYYTRDPHTNIRTELLMQLKNGKRTLDDDGRVVYLKPTEKDNEFVTWYPHAVDPKKLERKVIIDQQTMTWRYADIFDTTKIDVEMMEGKSHIKLYGDYYELLKNSQDKYEIILQTKDGVTEYLPVYMEPLTRKWHIATHFAQSVFSAEQEKILNQLQVEIDHEYSYVQENNNNPQYYGTGKTWHTEKIGDDTRYVYGRYIEINGKLVPVRQKVVPAHGVRYEIYDIKNPDAKAWQVEWDGNRWLFESTTSAQITPEIEKLITPDMFITHIEVNTLSAPDSKGIRWNAEGKNYLKVDDKYIEIHELNSNRYSIGDPTKQNSFVIRFADNKFHKETESERLGNIFRVGLGGKKRTHPADVLKEVDGFNDAKARELLAQYRFQKNGVYNANTFVMEIEQNGEIPYWAERFKIPRPKAEKSDVLETVSVTDSRFPELTMAFRLGKAPDEQDNKDIYFDADDATFIIKKYNSDGSTGAYHQANKETEQFNRYYGAGAAQLFHDQEKNYYVRMYHLPGEPLEALTADTLTADAGKKFVDLFEKTSLAGIEPEEFRSENIAWDAKTKSFHLINSLHEETADTAAVSNHAEKDNLRYWNEVLTTLEELVGEHNNAPVPADKTEHLKDPQAEELARHKEGVAPGGQQHPEQPETAVHADKAADAEAKDVVKADADAVVKDASANLAALSFEEQIAAMNMRKSPLDRLLFITTPKYIKLSNKLDEIINTILANKDTALHNLQKMRLLSLKKALKDEIDKGSDIPQLAKFIDDNRAEVLNPGYASSLPHNKNFEYKTVEHNLWLFNVKTTKGGAEAETLLYPEDGGVELQQAELDATEYEVAVSKLPDNERKALRTWTGLPEEAGKIYSDNTISTGLEISFELNRLLRDGLPLSEHLQTFYGELLSALAPGKLPTQKGEYIRTASYNFGVFNPWTSGKIATGDIVSNGKQFMSVSSDSAFAETYALKGIDNVKSIINYKINTRHGPAPLLPKALSLSTFENEYLYRPNAYFKVKEISIMDPLSPFNIEGKYYDLKLPARLGVVLEEVEFAPGSEQTIKDIFSGESWTVNTPEKSVEPVPDGPNAPGNDLQI